MQRCLVSLAAAAAILACSATAWSKDYDGFGPIVSRVQNPAYLQAISLMPQRAEVIPQGDFELRVDSAYSNLFEQGQTPTSLLNFDMEYWRLGFNARYGISRGMELGIEIPMIHFDGGFLDSFIQKFHSFFGFPNAGRERANNNEFHYRFDAGGKKLFDFSPLTAGLGDITLRFKHQVTGEDSDWPAIAWFADFKFPTGQSSRGVSDGTFDYGLGLALDASWRRLHGYFNVGYYVIGGNELIDDFMHHEALQFAVAGEVSILPDLSVIVQLEGGTPLLTGTGMNEWDGVPLDLVIGFRGEERNLLGEGGDLLWQVAFAEDVTSQGPSVDFTVYMTLGFRFDLFNRKRPSGDWVARH
jgi:hypothetical protein